MGITVASMVERLPENIPRRYRVPVRYPVAMSKRILLHTLRGLVFLHENGVTHGDLQPGNILFSINNIQSIPEDSLKQDESQIVPLRRVDGKLDRWAPKTLYLGEPLFAYVRSGQAMCLKLSDLGAGGLGSTTLTIQTEILLSYCSILEREPAE